MKTTIEISMYPLSSDYEESIIKFIKTIKSYPLVEVYTNAMSTYLKGDFDVVWAALGEAFSKSFALGVPMSNVVKIIPRDLPVEEGWLDF